MKISKRTSIANLRSIWPKETDFSDWLVTEDGLELIASDMGIQVENPQRECRPGDFPCDIVGHVLGDENHKVVIENQFGRTDHDHLGKLLTYTAAHSATTAIWITEEVSDDHRKVIDWLNDNTPPSISLYLAQLKAYKIGDSPVAPQLDIVCRPNLQVKVQHENISEASKETQLWRKQFWEEILTYIKSRQPPFSVQSASADSWINISIGRSNIYLELTLTPRNKCIACALRITVAWKDEAFKQLKLQEAAIETEIGEPLQWLSGVGQKSSKIMLKANIDPSNPLERDQVKTWMYERSLGFYQAFHGRVNKLTPPIETLMIDHAEADDE
jgi:hypothetical protein